MKKDGWDRVEERWKRTARKGPWSLFAKIVVTVLLLSVIFGAIGMVCGTAKEAVQVARDEFGPKALLKKYEWFKDMAATCDKLRANVKVTETRIDQMEQDYSGVSRNEWDRVDKQTMSQWKAEFAGIKGAYNDAASRYNAQMAKFNWRFTEMGSLPEGATEPLPREFKPYVEK